MRPSIAVPCVAHLIFAFIALATLLMLRSAHAQDGETPSKKTAGRMPGIDGGMTESPPFSPKAGAACPIPRAIVPFDPTAPTSAPGPLPSASRPALDVVGATASFNSKETKGTLVFAPFALFADEYKPIASETRIELRTGFGDTQSFGGSLSLGYSTASELSTEQLQEVQEFVSTNACESLANRLTELVGTVNALAKFLAGVAATRECAENVSTEPTDVRGGELVTCFRDHKQEMSEEDRGKGKEFVDAFLKQAEGTLSQLEDAWLKSARGKRLEIVFQNAVIASVKASFDAFPVVYGPKVTETDGTMRKPIPNEFNSFAVTFSLAYFVDDRLGFWLTGGAEEQRPTPTDPVSTRLIGSLEGAWNVPVGDADDNGFRTGTALGLAARLGACQDSVGCKDKILGYADAIATEHVIAGIPFFDIRLSSSVQFRLAVPVTYYRLTHEQNDGKDSIVTVVPTLSTSVSHWKTEVN